MPRILYAPTENVRFPLNRHTDRVDMEEKTSDVTELISSWRSGDERAFDRLLAVLYDDLRSLAAARLAGERSDHTLQPTALVHEAWLRLQGHDPSTVDSRIHFFAAAAQVMRRILVEHARGRRTDKRGGGRVRVTLGETPAGDLDPELLDVHHALEDLERVRVRQARLVELRYFGGFTVPEAAGILGVSVATAEREWTAARLWLRRRLEK